MWQARENLQNALAGFEADANADLAAALRGELRGCVLAYEAAKAKAGALDFLDLLLKTRDLIRDNPEVRSSFQQRFKRIFVDEFQDTDPLQAEILLLLAADDPADDELARNSPGSREALFGRRSEAVDLSLPARGRWDLPQRIRDAAGGGR